MADELPEDLQPALVDQDEYVFPNNNRRRIAASLYVVIGALFCRVACAGHDVRDVARAGCVCACRGWPDSGAGDTTRGVLGAVSDV